MIQAIISFSIRNKLIVGIFLFILIATGIYSAFKIPIDAVPDITDNQVQVITLNPRLATQEVEKFITYPLEISMNNIPGVEQIRSVSRFGLSVITVVFEEKFDIYLARQLINERLQQASDELPEGVNPELGPISSGLGEIYQYVIHPAEGYEDQYTSMDLRTIQDWIIRRQLSSVPGVVEVNSSGGYLKQYEISIDPVQLLRMDVTLDEIFKALEQNNENAGGSYLEKKHNTYFIRGEGLMLNKSDIRNTYIKHRNGLPLYLHDIATINWGHAPRLGAVTMNGMGEVVAGQVMMLKGANSAEVTRAVKAKLEVIKQALPEGIVVEPYLDRMKLINRTTKTVLTNLIEGGLIVIFVLVLLLGNLRAGLIVASVIPLSMLFALSMMRLFGVSANLMSLGAIDFGLIVDGSVIVVESIVHRLGLRKSPILNQSDMDLEVMESSSKIRKSAAFGELIILIVYLPILFLVGIEGKMFRPMAQTVSFAILGALILSMTYVPMVSALWIKYNRKEGKNLADRIIHAIYRVYRPALDWSLKKRWIVLLLVSAIVIISGWRFSKLGGEFIPTLEEGDFALHQILPPGSSIKQSVEVSSHLQNIITDNFPEVEKVVTKIGTSEIPFDIMPMEAGDIFVILKPKKEWVSASDRESFFARLEEKLDDYPGVGYEFTQPIQMRFNELMTGVRQDIAIKIFGENMGTLWQKANEVKHLVDVLPGAADVKVEVLSGLQQISIEYDRLKMAKYGINIATVNQAVQTAFAGAIAGKIYEDEKSFDLVVRLNEQSRQGIQDLRHLFVKGHEGNDVPLIELASIQFEEGPVQISREDTKRRITIGVNARNRDVESLVNEIKVTLARELQLPPGYLITYGGQFENLEKARKRLSIAVPVALVLILILLYFTFNSMVQTLLIFTSIPLSAIGGIWALHLRDMPFSISAGVGFIALFGVAVLNGIVLISYLNQLKKEGVSGLYERIFIGTQVRLRPVILTAAVASLGFLPMALSNTAGAEVQRPLATVVIGGLITATILTLIILPILYLLVERYQAGKSKSTIKSLLIGGLIFCSMALDAQTESISLHEAIEMATTKHLVMAMQQGRESSASALLPLAKEWLPTEFVFSGEEYRGKSGEGVYSLGVVQSFKWPGSNVALKEYYEANYQYVLANKGLVFNQVSYVVESEYYEMVYLQEKANLLDSIKQRMDTLMQIAQLRYETGTDSKLPLQRLQIESQSLQSEISHILALLNGKTNAWNEYFQDTIQYVPRDQILQVPLNMDSTTINPYLTLMDKEAELMDKAIDRIRVQQKPQIIAGARLQWVDGEFPFSAAQIGIQVPLNKGSNQARIRVAEYEAQVVHAEKEYMLWRYKRRQKLLEAKRKLLAEKYFRQKQITHNYQELVMNTQTGYRLGSTNALEIREAIEQFSKAKLDLQQLKYDLQKLAIEYKYLIIN